MNPVRAETTWSRGRWWSAIVVVLALHVLSIFLLGERTEVVQRRAARQSFFTLVSGEARTGSVSDLMVISDPTLFALPNPISFSGRAWLSPGQLPRPSFERNEPETWLTQSVAGLGSLPDEQGRKNRMRYRTFDQKLAPVVSRIEAPPLPLPQRSSVQVGSPEGRVLIHLPEPPSVPHADVLANTVVQAGVAPSGFLISSVVLSSSGSAVADQLALDATRAARFKPIRASDPLAVTWATFTFRWHTVAPTNPSPLTVPLR